jgi:hypothetical protein
MLYVKMPKSDTTSPVRVSNAQFVFAPKSGEARLVRMTDANLPQSALDILNTHAKIGDRISIDRILLEYGDTSIYALPIVCEIVEHHKFSEFALSAANINFKPEYTPIKNSGTMSQAATSNVDWNYTYNIAIATDTLNGEILYYDSSRNVVSKAIFKDNNLVSKEYYFSGYGPKKIRRTIERMGHYHLQKHYDTIGYLVAEGTVAYFQQDPVLLPLKPRRIRNSPFDSLNLEGEYRPDGDWKMYNQKGEVVAEFLLVLNGNGIHSVQMNGVDSDAIEKKQDKPEPRKINAPKKYRRLITPDF